jgi:glycosyltransferase involved in cell wall biosynthesis
VKVVMLVQSLGVGGLELLVERLTMRLRRDRHDVRIVTSERGGTVAERMAERGVELTHAPLGRSRLSTLRTLRRELLRGGTQAVHLHGLPASTWGRAALVGASPRIVAHYHTEPSPAHRPTLAMKIRERTLARLVPGPVLAVSGNVRRDLVENLGVPPARVQILSGGVPDQAPGERAEARRELAIAPDRHVLLCVASLTPPKRHGVLLRALARIPDALLLLAGEGPQRASLERLARTLGVQDRVRMLGMREDVERLAAAADAGVLASWPREGLPLAVLELMRAARPVVATRVGGIPEAVEEGATGLLVEPERPAELAQACRRLLEDPVLARRMGQAGREHFLHRYEMERYLEELLAIYEGRRP